MQHKISSVSLISSIVVIMKLFFSLNSADFYVLKDKEERNVDLLEKLNTSECSRSILPSDITEFDLGYCVISYGVF